MRSNLIAIVSVLFLFFCSLGFAEASKTLAPCSDCNILLISMDTVRADRIGAINPKSKLSPNIDRFAKESYIYLNAFAQAPWTLPSHRSVFYGLHPWRMPFARTPTAYMAQPLRPLPVLLHAAGYKTGAFTSGVFITPEFGFDQGFDQFEQSGSWKDADFIAEKATHWIQSNRSRKFFLFLHSYHVHDPFEPQLSSLKKIDPSYRGKLNSISFRKLAELEQGKAHYSQADLKRISVLYDAEVLELDRTIGKIVAEIGKLGLEKKTIVILFSDHGEEFSERGHIGFHGYSLYNEQLHVPLIVRSPSAERGVRIESPVELTDLFSTILHLGGVTNPGVSMESRTLPVTDTPGSMLRPIYAETHLHFDGFFLQSFADGTDLAMKRNIGVSDVQLPPNAGPTMMVMQQGMKLVLVDGKTSELYSLETDPAEKVNLYGKDSQTQIRLEKLLHREF